METKRSDNMTTAEELLGAINKLRRSPLDFIEYLEKRLDSFVGDVFTDQNGGRYQSYEGASAVTQCIRKLRSTSPIQELKMLNQLNSVAGELSKYLCESGDVSHSGKNFSQLPDRLNKYGVASGEVGEIIAVQEQTAIDYILYWIIGDGDPDREDFSLLLNRRLKNAGISISPHPAQKYCVVVVLAQEFSATKSEILITQNSIKETLPDELEQL